MTRFLTTVRVTLLTVCVAYAQVTVTVAYAQADADPLTANQWVQPTEAGTFSGRVILPSGDGMSRAVEGANVTITSIDGGDVSGQAVTDGMGEFTIAGVTPGVYSVTSRAEMAYAHLSMHVIDSSLDLGGRFPTVAEIPAVNMSYEAVDSTVSRFRSPNNNRVISMANADLDALADRIINGETFRVAQFDGGINGRLFAAGAEGPNLIPSRMSNVFIMRVGVEVGRTVTNEFGDFRIENLPVGDYSLLAVGRDGLVAIGFEVVAEGGGNVSKRTTDGKQLVSAARAASTLSCQQAPFTDDDGAGRDDDDDGDVGGDVVTSNDFMEGSATSYAVGGGGAGTGYYSSGGGAGGGAGGGGLGSLGGLAGVAGVFAGAASNGSGMTPNITPPTASDFLPETEIPNPEINP